MRRAKQTQIEKEWAEIWKLVYKTIRFLDEHGAKISRPTSAWAMRMLSVWWLS